MPQPTASAPRRRFVDTGSATPKAKPDHLLYMSENDEEFFITEDASTSASNPPPVPTAFSMLSGPSIYVPSGSIQEWKIENRTNEAHAFHIHQVHFRVLQRVPAQSAAVDSLDQVALRDTVDLPAYSGVGDPPSVTLRVFFNEPDIRGNFLYHCHILEHEDKGMMAIVRVVDRSEMPVALKSGGKRVAVAGQRGGAGPKLVQPVALQSLGRDDRDRSRADQEEEVPILRDRNGEVIDGQFCSATSQKYPLRSASTRQSSKRVSRVKISEIRSLLP